MYKRQVHAIHNFDGVVSFTDLSTNSNTVIHGENITTGRIKGANFDNSSGTMGGMEIQLSAQTGATKIIHAKNTSGGDAFYVTAAGDALFKGVVSASSFSGSNAIGSASGDKITVGNNITLDGQNQIITISDCNNIRVKIGQF